MDTKEIEAKFEALALELMESGGMDFVFDRIPFAKKQEILEEWEAGQAPTTQDLYEMEVSGEVD